MQNGQRRSTPTAKSVELIFPSDNEMAADMTSMMIMDSIGAGVILTVTGMGFHAIRLDTTGSLMRDLFVIQTPVNKQPRYLRARA